jgi:hypothetical protein
MAVYAIDRSSDAATINGIEAALTAGDALTATLYKTSNRLIFSTPHSNKVIRLATSSLGRVHVYAGDAWVSGDAVTNQITINANAAGAPDAVMVVITADVLAIAVHNSANNVYAALFARAASVAAEYLALGWTYNAGGSYMYDTTNDRGVHVRTLAASVIDATGYYYQMDPVITTEAGVLIATGISGVKTLLMGPDPSSAGVTVGDDVIICGGGALATPLYFNNSFLIEDGVAWEPA